MPNTPTLTTTLTLGEILDAFKPAWSVTSQHNPDYLTALENVWDDIVLAAAQKERRIGDPARMDLKYHMEPGP